VFTSVSGRPPLVVIAAVATAAREGELCRARAESLIPLCKLIYGAAGAAGGLADYGGCLIVWAGALGDAVISTFCIHRIVFTWAETSGGAELWPASRLACSCSQRAENTGRFHSSTLASLRGSGEATRLAESWPEREHVSMRTSARHWKRRTIA